MLTRQDYLNDPAHRIDGGSREAAAALHRRYYAQFVDAGVVARVANAIGRDALFASKDPHFSDIPLPRWDRLAQNLGPLAISFESVGDYATLGGLVCVAKEAARQFVEQSAQS